MRDGQRYTRSTLERVLRFQHAIQHRSSTHGLTFRWGIALFNSDFPLSWAHNFLRVEGAPEDVTVEGLVHEAERLHGAAGHSHRQITIEDEATGARLEAGFKELGWSVERLVVMVNGREPDRPDLAAAREVSFEEVKPALDRFYREAPYGDSEETVRQLVERSLVTARATDVRHFAVSVDGRVVSSCELYSDGRTAQIEDVATFEEFRNRGFARATILSALEAARSAGCDLVFLEADHDDWPKHLYLRLGFDALACSYQFVKPGHAGDDPAPHRA